MRLPLTSKVLALQLEVLAAALSKAAATLPEVAGKYVKANLQRCAELLHEQLVEVAPPKAAAGKRGAAAAADKEGAWPAKAAKRAKTAAVLSPGRLRFCTLLPPAGPL